MAADLDPCFAMAEQASLLQQQSCLVRKQYAQTIQKKWLIMQMAPLYGACVSFHASYVLCMESNSAQSGYLTRTQPRLR